MVVAGRRDTGVIVLAIWNPGSYMKKMVTFSGYTKLIDTTACRGIGVLDASGRIFVVNKYSKNSPSSEVSCSSTTEGLT